MRKLTLRTWVLAVLSAVLATSALAQDRPRVVAVNYALQYLAERLVGEEAEVVFPVPDGVDPSFWRPSITDISEIQSADLILLNGAAFASWVDRVSLPRSKVVNTSSGLSDQFIVTESITHSHGDGGSHSHEGVASYTWLDPSLAIAQAEAIAGKVAARGIADPDVVYARLEALRGALEALEAETTSALANLSDTVLIATHPRYQYFARAYGLEIVSLEWDAGAAPTADQLADLQNKAAERGATVLIWEAEPTAEALEATAALGLENVVFPPLAQTVAGADFLTSYAGAVSALSNAVAAAN